MALSISSSLFSTQCHCHPLTHSRIPKTTTRTLILAMASNEENTPSAKLVTFLGKGGSGKTLSSIFAAQGWGIDLQLTSEELKDYHEFISNASAVLTFEHYASAGLNTCLVIHSQDSTADHLLNCKIGPSPIRCNNNLSAVRLETTKMLLEPLKRLKEADARLNLTQGVLEGVVGEELGVLPGMDSIFSLFTLERYLRFMGFVSRRKTEMEQFDLIVYDGISPEETLRMIGAASKARLYLRYLRNMAEKTDIGRLAGPSILGLVDDAMTLTGSRSDLNGNTSAKIWDTLERMLERGASAFSDPHKFGCLLVMDPNNLSSVNSSLRYWGCAIQAGATVSGAFSCTPTGSKPEIPETVKGSFSLLPFASIPRISFDSTIDWNAVMSSSDSKNAREALSFSSGKSNSTVESVKFDPEEKSVTLFMPGFDKSEIKLYQYRGGSELLVEAGDQRRVIRLPPKIQGKVGGAKFVDRSLLITLR